MFDIFINMNIKNVTKEEMKEVLETSKSLREVIIKFNLSPNGSGGYRNIKNKIINLDLEIPKYNYYGSGYLKNKLKDDEVFIENSTYPRQKLKQRIIKNKLLKYECQKCNLKDVWQGEEISLQLDHINGVNDDNRLENLRFLCPNCHSQTNSYGGKNNKKNKVKNYNRPRKIKNRPDLDTLLNNVKNLGYRGTGQKYNVSDNCIRKWVKSYQKQM
jgi:5-methylcytosine-specific restriction endonuclease McrA